MFPVAPAAPFARNVTCRRVLVIYISLIFKVYYVLLRFLTLYYDICNISRCVTEALRHVTVIHDLSRLLARSIKLPSHWHVSRPTFYYVAET